MKALRRPISALLSLGLLALAGCSVPLGDAGGPPDALDSAAGDPSLTWSVVEGEAAFAWSTAPQGLIEAPSEILAFVDHDLDFDVVASDPALGHIAPGPLPGDAEFTDREGGGSVHWKPQVADIGAHALVFLLVDAAEPDLVLAQTTVTVQVLPVNKLIEYGF